MDDRYAKFLPVTRPPDPTLGETPVAWRFGSLLRSKYPVLARKMSNSPEGRGVEIPSEDTFMAISEFQMVLQISIARYEPYVKIQHAIFGELEVGGGQIYDFIEVKF